MAQQARSAMAPETAAMEASAMETATVEATMKAGETAAKGATMESRPVRVAVPGAKAVMAPPPSTPPAAMVPMAVVVALVEPGAEAVAVSRVIFAPSGIISAIVTWAGVTSRSDGGCQQHQQQQ